MVERAETYDAIRKALATLDDPFTRLLEPARLAALRRGNAGSVTGVGLEVGFDTTPSSPAQSALVVRRRSAGKPCGSCRYGARGRCGVTLGLAYSLARGVPPQHDAAHRVGGLRCAHVSMYCSRSGCSTPAG